MNKLLWMGLITALGMSAAETRAWRQTDFADFEKGSLKRLSLRSDGRLTLAPVLKELFDPSVGYLWAVAEDSKGNLYVGGGSTSGPSAKLYKIDAAGKSSTAAELEGLEIHAIAIDSKDAVYAATAPDGKVYRIRAGGGKPEVFFDPKAKYIWSLAFGANGDLFIGTGDKGEIYRVSPNGKGSIFFKTDEAHARSLAADGQGNLIVGTEPSGLVLRITPSGQGFVLHQTAKREVTAVAVSGSGTIYAAAVGIRGASAAPIAAPPPPPPPVTPPAAPGAVNVRVAGPAQPSGLPPAAAAPSVAGGTDVYRIEADGYARRVWSHPAELAYSIVLDSQDRPVIATGNKGGLYRIEPMQRFTLLANLAPTQVTQIVASRNGGAMYAVTGNIGKVYKIGPGLEADGVFESDLFDVGGFTYWGRSSVDGRGAIRLETRSGNLNDSHKNWSEWAQTADSRIQSPAARFLQYRLTLGAAQDGSTPDVTSVDVKYQSKNVAPVVEQVEITPPNYKFPAPASTPVGPVTPSALTLPAIGQKHGRNSGGASAGDGGTAALSYSKGYTGVRWSASDENGDALVFKIEIRGVKESEWKLLRDKIRERYFSWDSTAFADGEYVVRISASDSPSNTPEQSLAATLESEPFLIDNSAPEIQGLSSTASGTRLNVSFQAKDALSNIVKAEYSLNGGDWIVAEPSTRLSDAKELSYRFAIDRLGATAEYVVAVRVTDEFDNQSVSKVSGK